MKPSVPPVNTVPPGGQRKKLVMIKAGPRARCGTLCSTSQHGTTWWSEEKTCDDKGGAQSSVWNPLFHQSTRYHMVVRWKTCDDRGRAQSSVWNPLFYQSARYHMAVRWKACEERGWDLSSARSSLLLTLCCALVQCHNRFES